MTAARYESSNDKFDNNKDKIYLLLRRWGLVSHMLNYIVDKMLDHILGSHAKSHNYRFCDHSIIIAFFFGVSFDK